MGNNRTLKVVAIMALVGIVVLGVGGVLAMDQAAPAAVGLMRFDPNPAVGVTGSSVDVSVVTEDVTNVYGVEFEVLFDPDVLQVVDADTGPSSPGVQITPGTCPAPNFVASNSADNGTGTINYAATQLNPTQPCDGGEAASITFQCASGFLEKVTTPITFTTTIISDPDGSAIAHTSENGIVECEANIFFVDGEVILQSWPDPSGVEVVLLDDQGAAADGPVIVGPDGLFSLLGKTGNIYTLEATYPRYLNGLETGITSAIVGEHVVVGPTTLRAGDINGDGKINILDVSGVAGNFGKASPQPWTP